MSKNIIYHFLREEDFVSIISENMLTKSPLSDIITKSKIKFDQLYLLVNKDRKYFISIFMKCLKEAVENEHGGLFNLLNRNFARYIDSFNDVIESYFKKKIKAEIFLKSIYNYDTKESYSEKLYQIINDVSENNNLYIIQDSAYEEGTDVTTIDDDENKNIHFIVNGEWYRKNTTDWNSYKYEFTGGFDEELKAQQGKSSQFKIKKSELKSFNDIYTANPEMYDIISYAKYISSFDDYVLILGDTGTGKEIIAQAIHTESKRSKKPFIAINCSAIPETLFESELFGIEKDIATGVKERIGMIEMAEGGSLFLDEIGDLSPLNQAKLLRALQERKIRRLGGKKDIIFDVRIISATNKPIESETNDFFRNDLFYRINEMQIMLPTLKERGKNDIHLLLSVFMEEEKSKHPEYRKINLISQVLDYLYKYPWPGNIRELKLFVKRALSIASFLGKDINNHIRSMSLNIPEEPSMHIKMPEMKMNIESELLSKEPFSFLKEINFQDGLVLKDLLNSIEKYYVREAYKLTRNEEKAGLLLGYRQGKMSRKIKDYDLKKYKN